MKIAWIISSFSCLYISTSSHAISQEHSMIDITLRHVSSFQITYEITDVECNRSYPITLKPWDEVQISICSDGRYGKIIYRDISNPPETGIEASFLRDGTHLSI